MTVSIPDQLQAQIKEKLKVSHLQDKVDCKVVSFDHLNRNTKSKILEEKGKDFLNGDGVILGFTVEGDSAVANEEPQPEPTDTADDEGDGEGENIQAPDTGDGQERQEGTPEETEPQDQSGDSEGDVDGGESEQETEDDEGENEDGGEKEGKEEDKEDKDDKNSDKKKKKKDEDDEELNESVKVQDLTSSMCTQIKTGSSSPKKKQCVKENECCEDKKKKKKSKNKRRSFLIPVAPIPPGPGPQPGPEPGPQPGPEPGPMPGPVDEADKTEATGIKLVAKVQEMLQQMFKANVTDSNRVELLPIADIPNAYYCILKFGEIEK